MKEKLIERIKKGEMTDADLTGANLTDADLTGANLRYANLEFVSISGIGSVGRMTTYVFETGIIFCGCFRGNLEQFETIVKKTHENNKEHLEDYLNFIAFIKNKIEFKKCVVSNYEN